MLRQRNSGNPVSQEVPAIPAGRTPGIKRIRLDFVHPDHRLTIPECRPSGFPTCCSKKN